MKGKGEGRMRGKRGEERLKGEGKREGERGKGEKGVILPPLTAMCI